MSKTDKIFIPLIMLALIGLVITVIIGNKQDHQKIIKLKSLSKAPIGSDAFLSNNISTAKSQLLLINAQYLNQLMEQEHELTLLDHDKELMHQKEQEVSNAILAISQFE